MGSRHIVITIDAGVRRCGRCHKRDGSWCSQFGYSLGFYAKNRGGWSRCPDCLDADLALGTSSYMAPEQAGNVEKMREKE